jgi:hypothetical protein
VSSRWCPGPGVGVVRQEPPAGLEADGHKVYVAHLPDGPIQVLEGTAAVVFSSCLEHAAEALRHGVAGALGVPVDDLDEDVLMEFVAELEESGLLAQREHPQAGQG